MFHYLEFFVKFHSNKDILIEKETKNRKGKYKPSCIKKMLFWELFIFIYIYKDKDTCKIKIDFNNLDVTSFYKMI